MTHPVSPASAADAESIARIEAEAASTRWSLRAVRSTLEQPTTRAFIVHSDGEVVGHLLSQVAAMSAEVLTIAVLPAHRRGGRANALMARAEATWIQADVEDAFLEVRASNSAAIALYTRRGWEQVGNRRGYYVDGEDAVIMRWQTACG